MFFSLYKNSKLKVKLSRIEAHERKKTSFFVTFVLYEGHFFLTFVFYLNVWCIEYNFRICHKKYIRISKTLHHTLLLPVLKMMESIKCIVKYVIFWYLNSVNYVQMKISLQKFTIYLFIHSRRLLYLQGKMSLTPEEQKIVEHVVDETMTYIRKNDPKYYEKLMGDPDVKNSVINAAKGVAEEQVPLNKYFIQEPPNIEEILS